MGGTDSAAELELGTKTGMDCRYHITIAGHVDKGCGQGGIHAANGIIGEGLVAGAKARHEVDIAWRGQTHHLRATVSMVEEKVGQAKACLGGRAADQHLLRPEEIVIHKVVVDDVGGGKEREEQATLVFHGLQRGRVAVGALIIVVDTRQVSPVSGTIRERPFGH